MYLHMYICIDEFYDIYIYVFFSIYLDICRTWTRRLLPKACSPSLMRCIGCGAFSEVHMSVLLLKIDA